VFYKAGFIESWGRGTIRMAEECIESGLPSPDYSETNGVIRVFFQALRNKNTTGKTPVEAQNAPVEMPNAPVEAQNAPVETPNAPVEELLAILSDNPLTRTEMMQKLQMSHKQNFLLNYIQPALQEGLIERTIPDKPTSRLQKYRLTEMGIKLKQEIQNKK